MAAQLDAAGEKTVEVTISWFAGVFEALGIKTKTITAFAKVIAGRIPAPTTKELEMRGKEVRKAEAAAKPTAISIFRRRG